MATAECPRRRTDDSPGASRSTRATGSTIFPVLAGGQRLIEGIDTTHLRLLDTTTFESGIVVHVCGPKWRAMRLNHVALTVSDRERSARFYGEHFGLVERVHEDGHLLILGSGAKALLALSEGTPPDVPRTNHFGFQLATGDDVHSARRRLRAAAVPEAEWQEMGGMVRVQIRDPDGYLVDLYALTGR